MGLDMYLDKELYVSEYSNGGEQKDILSQIYKLINVTDNSGNFKHLEIKIPAIYWRKSNQIHNWFVKNVQNGVDDCGDYYVDVEQLQELLKLVEESLKTKKPLLEPVGGFFFGSTDVDEYYWGDLKRTRKELKREIKFYDERMKLKENWTFKYHSSW